MNGSPSEAGYGFSHMYLCFPSYQKDSGTNLTFKRQILSLIFLNSRLSVTQDVELLDFPHSAEAPTYKAS